MARPYRDAVELITEPIPADVRGRLNPEGAVWVLGAVSAGTAEHVPIVLLPGFEYRLRAVDHDGEPVWLCERRKALDTPDD